MLKSQEYTGQIQTQINDRFILNPIELLVYELQSKDINSKKQSIENIEAIALAMSESEITNSLFPFLMKMLVQENNKDLKLSILKSFRNIFPLLSKQKSYLKLLQILFDVAIVFEQTQLKNEALSILNLVLFEQDILEFDKFKLTFKGLIMTELKAITEPSTSRNAKQLSIYLIKYLLHNSRLFGELQVKQIIQFMKDFFIQPSENNDFSNIKILAQNLHLLVQKWPQNSTSQLDFFINSFSGFGISETQEENKQPLNQDEEPQKPKQQPQNKQNQQSIPKQIQQQIKCSVLPALIAYGKYIDVKKAYSRIEQLLNDENTKIKIVLIKKSKQIFETFKNQNLSLFLDIFKNFSSQHQDVKKAILQVIDEIDLEQTTKNQSILKNCKNTIELKNILIQSLIRNNKSESVSQILSESDFDFKVKIFMKLPDSLLHKNVTYADIVDSLLSEPKKNFRSKLNIILNLISRIQDNTSKLQEKNEVCNMGQTFDVSYMITPLVKYFGDRISIIRVNVAKLYGLIMCYYKVDFSSLRDTLEQSFYGENKGWFERQNVLFMIKEYLLVCFKGKNQTQNKMNLKNKNLQFYNFITKVLRDTLQGNREKFSSKKSTQKLQIKNIRILAEQIVNRYSIQP